MSQSAESHLLPVFARADVAFDRGEGCWLIATNGDRYLDFGSGVAVNGLGHCHPHLVAAMTAQLSKVWHVSNLSWTTPMPRTPMPRVRWHYPATTSRFG